MRTASPLDERIAAWKKPIAGRLGADTADELESHLRELIEADLAAGRTADEAWRSATVKIGDTESLRREFAKVGGRAWIDWAFLALVALVTAGFVLPLVAYTAPKLEVGGEHRLLGAHVLAVSVGYIATLACGLIGFYAACRGMIGGASNRTVTRAIPWLIAGCCGVAAALSLVGVVLGAVWASDKLGGAWGWTAAEIGGACVVLYQAAVCFAALARRITTDMLLALATVGAAVTLLAWLGPPALGLGLHSYGFPSHTVGVVLLMAVALSAGVTLLAVRRGRPQTL